MDPQSIWTIISSDVARNHWISRIRALEPSVMVLVAVASEDNQQRAIDLEGAEGEYTKVQNPPLDYELLAIELVK